MADQHLDITASTDTQHLLVACAEGATLRTVENLFAAATPTLTVDGYDGIETALAQDAAAPVIVPVTLPLDHLRETLEAGTAPDEALAGWRAGAEALLRTCRKARRRVLLIDAGMLEVQPEACARALGTRLGLSFETVPQAREAKAERSAIHATIGATLLASDTKALDFLDEIEAMILGPVSPRNPERSEIVSAMKEAVGMREERDLLRENLAQMLEETERLLGETADLKGKLEARNTELVDKHLLKAQLDAVTRQLDTARESMQWRDSILGSEILKLASQERDQRNEIARIHASTSWKVTAPLRATRQSIRRS